MLAAFGLWLFCAGGCAMLPFALTTTASLVMPQTASLAMSGIKGAYNTAYLASDERDMNTILRDNMLTFKAHSAILSSQGSSDVHVYAYNGDVFAVGVVETEADRDRIIQTMQDVKGVGKVKGYIRLRDPNNPTAQLADSNLDARIRMALARYVLHKNSGVEIEAVQGDVCLMGVVGTYAEALDLIQYVESVSGARARSLLAIRDEYATGRTQTNNLYLLEPSSHEDTRGLTLQDDPKPLPSGSVLAAKIPAKPSILNEETPAQRVTWNKARLHMQQRLATFAKREANPQAKAELLMLATQVAQDRDLSIADRLSVAAAQAQHQHSRAKIQALLALF